MKTLVGGILLAIGILVAGASGLCSLFFLVTVIGSTEAALGIIPLILVFGGIPFAIGLGLFFLGRSLIRADREDAGE